MVIVPSLYRPEKDSVNPVPFPAVAARAAASALLLLGAFPPLDWGWLAWVALVPWLTAFPAARPRAAVGGGFVFAFLFFGGLMSWIGVFAGRMIGPALGGAAWVGAALSQTVLLMAFAGGADALRRWENPWAWRLGVPALWTLAEWARQFGPLGTGWGDLAYTQHRALPMLQLTQVTGVWGLSFLMMWVNVALASRAGRFRASVLTLALAVWLGGVWGLRQERFRPDRRAAALQGNIDQDVRRLPDGSLPPEYVRRAMATYLGMAHDAARQGAALVVWPETAFPGFLESDPALRGQVVASARRDGLVQVIGGVQDDPASKKEANALFLVMPSGEIAASYRKQKLVPFGEYVPYREQLPFLDALHLAVYDMVPGRPHQYPLDARPALGLLGAAICYDSTDGEVVRRQVAGGAELLVVGTDDTWFGRTAAARQHAAFAAVRAAEEDRCLIRAAATGVSQVIGPDGRVLAEADLFVPKVVAAPVEARRTRTFYSRFGDWFAALCALLLAGGLIDNRARVLYNKRKAAAPSGPPPKGCAP